MTSFCQELQALLLERPDGPFDPESARHLRDCAGCRRARANARWASRAFDEAAKSTPPIELPEALRESVLLRALERLDRPEPVPHRPDPRARLPAARPRQSPAPSRRRRVARFLTENRRRSAIWAGAAAVLTIVIVGLTAGGDSSIGRIDFAWQAVEIQGAGGRRIVRGIADAPLSAGATLRTGERAEAMAWLGGENQVRLAIGGSTNLTLRATNRIRLDGGSVWLSVKPGGEGFDVETPFGDVRVTGTIFGVSVDAESANVEVTEGSVRVEGPRGFVTLGAGERATATATDVSEPVARSEADRVAFWVAELHAAMNRAHAASYIPSVERAGDSPASLKGGRP